MVAFLCIRVLVVVKNFSSLFGYGFCTVIMDKPEFMIGFKLFYRYKVQFMTRMGKQWLRYLENGMRVCTMC